MRCALLCLKGPLMSFGGERIDDIYPTRRFPGHSFITGMVGNALGLEMRRREHREALQSIQDRMLLACREDKPGTILRDFQTALLPGDDIWTSGTEPLTPDVQNLRGFPHLMTKEALEGAVYTVGLSFRDPNAKPTLSDCFEALQNPKRPLYLGRKCYTPSRPVWLQERKADDALRAVRNAYVHPDRGPKRFVWVAWPERMRDRGLRIEENMVVHDRRDWINNRPLGVSFFYRQQYSFLMRDYAPG